jgi:hypothetical protein
LLGGRGEQLKSRWKIGRLGDAIEGTGTGHDAGASRSDAMIIARPFKAGNNPTIKPGVAWRRHDAGASRSDAMMVARPFKAGNNPTIKPGVA